MVNTFLTPSVIAEQALATLYESPVMLPLVYTDLTSEFGTQKFGNTINVRKPAVFTAGLFDRSKGIQPQDVTEDSVPVVLNKIPDVSFVVTDEDMSLKIEDFDARLLTPAMEAISQHIDKALIAQAQADVTQVAGTHDGAGTRGETWDRPEVLIEAKRLLDRKSVPASQRRAVVGSTTAARWLNTDLLKQADKSGSTEALRNGSLGRSLFGFESFQSANVPEPAANPAVGAPTTEVGVAFHESAFAYVSAPLEVPAGADVGQIAVRNYKGINIRVAFGWDIKYKQTIVSIDMLYGIKTLDKNRAVLLKGPDKA